MAPEILSALPGGVATVGAGAVFVVIAGLIKYLPIINNFKLDRADSKGIDALSIRMDEHVKKLDETDKKLRRWVIHSTRLTVVVLQLEGLMKVDGAVIPPALSAEIEALKDGPQDV